MTEVRGATGEFEDHLVARERKKKASEMLDQSGQLVGKVQASEKRKGYLMFNNELKFTIKSLLRVDEIFKGNRVKSSEMFNFDRLHKQIQEGIWIQSRGNPLTQSMHEHLIKLTMFFLASMICFLTANCQRNLFSDQTRNYPPQARTPRFYMEPNSQPTSHEQQLALSQQIIRHMMRSNVIPSQSSTEQKLNLLDPQETTDGPTGGINEQKPKDDDGKLLVCYYTTRKSERLRPTKESREFVFPAESLSETRFVLPHYESFVGGSDTFTAGFLREPQEMSVRNQLAKNQQQQLLFKSAAINPNLVGSPSGAMSSPVSLKMPPSMQPPTLAASQQTNKAKQAQHDGSLVQMLGPSESNLQPIQLLSSRKTLVIADVGKSKQAAAYNFIGDFEASNNGLIVGTTSMPLAATSGLSKAASQNNNGNNGANNNFIVAKMDDNKPNEQQMLISPSLARAFLVGGNQRVSNHEQSLETRFQGTKYSTNSTNNNNNNNLGHHNHNQAANSPVAITSGYSPLASKGKGVQFAGNTLSPVTLAGFTGSVSSSPSVPISLASSQIQSYTSTPLTALASQPQGNSLIQGGQVHFSNAPDQKLQFPTSNDNRHKSLPPELYEIKTSSNNLTPTISGQTLVSPSVSSSISSALVSSPLSTMFDVFGAASQYLMRFKPTSLISPSSFTFNTVSSGTLRQQLANNHFGTKPQSNTSTSLQDLNGSGSSSLVPLSQSSTGVQQKSTSNERSSNGGINSSSSSGSSIWSRFSGQNNQHREDVCGRTIQTPQRRIIGGEGARYGEFPYQVHIKIAKHQCGGALVDKQSIVTAAHCVYHFITRAPVSKLQIVIGAYDIEDEQYQELPPQYFKVSKVKLHPNFRFSASHPDRYDIAILKLDKPVKYTDNVLPVCLPNKDLKFENTVGIVTGFGKTDPSLSNRYGTRLLQKVDVPIIENNECERWHRTRGIDLKIFPEMMCAGYEDGLKDACVGDSGGPLVVKTPSGSDGSFRWTLAGITSAGFGCAQSRQPGIYHRVSHTVDWILDNLD